MESLRRSRYKQLLKARFKSIISMLESDNLCVGRENQGEKLGITGKEISDLLGGFRDMSVGLAETISKNLHDNLNIDISSDYLLGLSDHLNGNKAQTLPINNDFDINILKYINNSLGKMSLVCSYALTDKENTIEEIFLFDDLVTVSAFGLNDDKAIIEYNHGNKKEKHNITVLSVKIGKEIYGYLDFVSLYHFILKGINISFDNFNCLLSSFEENTLSDNNIIAG